MAKHKSHTIHTIQSIFPRDFKKLQTRQKYWASSVLNEKRQHYVKVLRLQVNHWHCIVAYKRKCSFYVLPVRRAALALRRYIGAARRRGPVYSVAYPVPYITVYTFYILDSTRTPTKLDYIHLSGPLVSAVAIDYSFSFAVQK